MKKTSLILIVLAASLALLSGCGTPPKPITAWSDQELAIGMKVSRDDFKKNSGLVSPAVSFGGDGYVDIYNYSLQALRDDGGETSYFLIIYSQRGYRQSWAFWRSAADEDGNDFTLLRVSTNVFGGGIVQETYAAELTRDYLDKLAITGKSWRAYGDKVQKEFQIAPNLVKAFLSGSDGLRN